MTREQHRQSLGELEAQIMNVVWQAGEATVQQVQRALQGTHDVAYTTVMTVMARLAEKALLVRRKEGRAFVYAPTTTREALGGSMLETVVSRVYGGSASRAVAHLIETDEEVGEEELDRLEELIRRKRQERGS